MRSRLLWLLLWTVAIPLPAAGQEGLDLQKLGNLVGIVAKSAGALAPIPEEREIEIGRRLASLLLGAAPLVDDPQLQRYVNRVGRWVALQGERAHLPWRFGVLDSPAINAFATPGGYIFVTRGLLEVMGSEAELAGVLAHEISHVLRKHHLEAIRKQAQTQMAVDIAGTMVSSNGQQLFNVLSKVGMGLYAKGLDRGDEYDADRVGVVLAARAGYDPQGLARFLHTLAAIGAGDARVDLMFSTHPPTADRARVLQQEMAGGLGGPGGQAVLAERYQRHVTSVR